MKKSELRTFLAFCFEISKGIKHKEDNSYEYEGSSNDLDQWRELLNEMEYQLNKQDLLKYEY